ncbi:MAG: polyprenyl synthetase family protein [Acidimicrobiales bacterium]|nr:polyprenyl synthetase family protein [Acidimicrobiales bacterium]
MTADLGRVDAELRKAVETEDDLLTEIAAHLIKAGGKRLRPGFAIASAAVGASEAGPASHEVVLGGVSVELVHLGSLYHDDVMDEAETRRTVDSVNARWGNLKAILGGDFLLAKASEIAAGLGTEVAGLLAATIAKLCEGQVRELRNIFNVGRSEENYLGAIAGKTAALFAAATRIGGIVGGLSRADIDRLTVFGTEYGMAFQIVDDILDVVSTEEELGKPSGNDLMQGVYTLPVIRTLSGPDRDVLLPLLGRPLSKDEVERPRALVSGNGSINDSVSTARGYIDRALEALVPLPDNAGTQALRGAAHHLLGTLPTSV